MNNSKENLLTQTIHTCIISFIYVLFFSFMINLLTLAMPLYTLQILDRVLSTGSQETLIMLSVIIVGTFICLSAIQIARSNIFLSIGSYFDNKLSPDLLNLQNEIIESVRSGKSFWVKVVC